MNEHIFTTNDRILQKLVLILQRIFTRRAPEIEEPPFLLILISHLFTDVPPRVYFNVMEVE